jgi:hypothetical protein
MNTNPTTLRRDAREVRAGEFVIVDQLARRVVRARQVVLADTPAAGLPATELIHARPDHPGSLAYLTVVHGAQVAVVVGI